MSSEARATAAVAAAAAAVGALGLYLWNRRTGRFAVVEVTPPPHPAWKPGEAQPMPFEDRSHVRLDPKDLKSCYALMISAVVPRPIAFVSTFSDKFGGNLAPFSYSGLFAHDPPTVGFSVVANTRAEDGKKDTLANIDESGDFVFNIMSEWFVEAANHCCGSFPRDVDEFDASGLGRMASEKVRPPAVREAAVQLECRLVHRHDIRNAAGNVTATLVLGEVVMIRVARALCEVEGAGPGKPTVQFQGLQPMGRLGGNTYARTTSTFDLPRPDRSVRNT